MISKWLRKKLGYELIEPISLIRHSVCAVLRVRREITSNPIQKQNTTPRFQVSIVGTAWCVVQNRYLVTAFHIFNSSQPRNPDDKFFVFSVPDNGPKAYHIPVKDFPLEERESDMAIIEIDPSSLPSANIPSISVSFQDIPDGDKVITYGFPAPRIFKGKVDAKGNWIGGELLLKSNANEGIVAGQFEINGKLIYELNIGWHHGESGGPIIHARTVSAIAVMQRYRNVQSPYGTVAGPHQGNSLRAIEDPLRDLGASIV